MKKTLSCISLLMIGIFGYNQNLVFNPSFEDSVANPDWGSFIYNMAGWLPTRESPDPFSPYCDSPMDHPPSHWVGYQQPYDGLNYIGLATYSSSLMGYRELAEGELISDLVIGQKYFFSMHVSLSDSCPSLMGIGPASNNIGVRFSVNSHYMAPPPLINNTAHINCDTICYDRVNWARISGSFVADSAYRYLTLGNFFDDANTDTALVGDGAMHYAYYFIDMVCLSTDSLECAPAISKPTGLETFGPADDMVIYPNPFVDLLHFKLNGSGPFEVILYDNTWRMIVKKSLDNKGTISLSGHNRGIYFYEIRKNHETVKFGKVIKV